MIRTKAQKQEIVTALAAKLKRSPTLYVTDFTGLNVARITDLRRRLRAAGVEDVVGKNTLALRALSEAQRTGGVAGAAGRGPAGAAGGLRRCAERIVHDDGGCPRGVETPKGGRVATWRRRRRWARTISSRRSATCRCSSWPS